MFLLGWGISNRTYMTELSGSTRVGKPAPDFALNLFDGNQIYFSSITDTPMVINFWASWCVPCIEEASILQSVWDSNRNESVEFIGINIQDSSKSAKAFIASNGIDYMNGFDDESFTQNIENYCESVQKEKRELYKVFGSEEDQENRELVTS